MGGQLGVAVEDAEAGVLDDDRDGLAGVSASDLQALAADHDASVGWDLPLGPQGLGGGWDAPTIGPPRDARNDAG
ncbi:hypothetical protein ADK59_36850 [Streptomyces sp. XY332]|nr:hypothetical protein VR46_39180 [Streptomyces sp. NRRL S-444]KOY53239.1 hypothetical protein ADK59_36850 [Streptomyces sp. XY332]